MAGILCVIAMPGKEQQHKIKNKDTAVNRMTVVPFLQKFFVDFFIFLQFIFLILE